MFAENRHSNPAARSARFAAVGQETFDPVRT
jgi:hypothetical protein